jgi:hypothetical protein
VPQAPLLLAACRLQFGIWGLSLVHASFPGYHLESNATHRVRCAGSSEARLHGASVETPYPGQRGSFGNTV